METGKNDLLTNWLRHNLAAMRARRGAAPDEHGPLDETGKPCNCGAVALTPHLRYRHGR